MEPAVDTVTTFLDRTDPGGVLALYLHGSAVSGGLRPDSDVDLLLVTERSLTAQERRDLLGVLLQVSGRRATIAPGRPVELTSVVRSDVVPWTYPPRCDFLYGEWLRDDFSDGQLPYPHESADLTVLFTTIFQAAAVLRGPTPSALLAAAPADDLQRAMRDCLEPLLGDLEGDERNVLLTLARMLVTAETGQIVPKDVAARRTMPELDERDQALLALAADAYRGDAEDDWSDLRDAARSAAERLSVRIRQHLD